MTNNVKFQAQFTTELNRMNGSLEKKIRPNVIQLPCLKTYLPSVNNQ